MKSMKQKKIIEMTEKEKVEQRKRWRKYKKKERQNKTENKYG